MEELTNESRFNDCMLCKKTNNIKDYICKDCIGQNILEIEPRARCIARTVDI